MTQIQSFPFSANRDARVLILGSMPGVESLRKQKYYAHPRNLFWVFMGEFFGAGRDVPYEKRLAVLRKNKVALWDVAHTCRRKGSLDSNITKVVPNDFKKMFTEVPEIHTVFFNGQKTAALFRKLILPQLKHGLNLITLPSTSSANASISPEKKREAWREILTALQL